MQLLLPLLLFGLLLQIAPGDDVADGGGVIGQLVLIGLMFALTGLAVRVMRALEGAPVCRRPVDMDDAVHNRRVPTRIRLASRSGMVVAIGVAGLLMSIPAVGQFGAGLVALAGLAGLAARAAQRNSIASLQITQTQPLSLNDCVMIENELGSIEEIASTYVVVRIRDERRLVVPINYFIDYPGGNWTRTYPGLMSTDFLWFDYHIPLGPLGQELQLIGEKAPEWDWKTCILQMCEAAEHSVKIRVLVSAVGMSTWWNLGRGVRVGLIDFVQRLYPQYLPTMGTRLQYALTGAPLVSIS